MKALLAALVLATLAAILMPAHASTITITCPEISATSDGQGNYGITCGAKVEPAPLPTPPTPTPPKPPVGTTCSTPSGVRDIPLKAAGQGAQFYAQAGQVWSWPLPAGVNAGSFKTSDYPGTPSMTFELTVSPCKGDVTWYQRGGTPACAYPNANAGGGMPWNTVASTGRQTWCVVTIPPPGSVEKWYVNYRILSGCSESQWVRAPDGTMGCPLNYYW